MSLKKFFEDKSKKIIKLVDYKATENLLKENVYTHDFIVSKELTLRRFIPKIDYSDPKNFAFFGNAERYYEDSIKRVYGTYPYDDSPHEKEQWFLSSSFLDLHVFRNDYPKSTGYGIFSSAGWGTRTSVSGAYGEPENKEYIYVKGGPHKNNVFNPADNKESNLKLDGSKGNTVEFFLKKSEFVNSLTGREVIFDCSTNDSDISEFGGSYGRFRVELDGNAAGSPFLVTYSSGSKGVTHAVVGNSITKSTVADNAWHHYAVSVANKGSNLEISLYIDGTINQTILTGSTCAANEVNLQANIGSLVKKITNTSTTAIGWGKLSGSLDEFRFWKVKRDAEQIGSNWRHQVAGGSNFEGITGDLGVYYKFNEGITTDADTDKVVLDYSGRVSNGNWIGYASTARNTGSAITESGANTTEFQDPIIRSNHPSVVSLLTEKKAIGKSHDMTNSSGLYSTFPNWMLSEDTEAYKGSGRLAELVQIIASYFDTLYIQTKVLPGLKSRGYDDYSSSQHLSGSKPAPFADKLLRSSGFVAPELFVESNVMDRILGQDANRSFEQDLTDIKNLIYKNIYNNLVHIYKSKGTESSFRNLIRCFGIDDELIKLNLYASDYTYEFSDTYLYKSEKVKGINFNDPNLFSATIFQQTSSYGSTHYMSGNTDLHTPYTIQADVIMPLKLKSGQKGFFVTGFLTSSIMGLHTPALAAGDTTFDTSDPAGIQVYAVHHPTREGAAKFVLTSSKGNVPHLETPFYEDVYDDKHWSISARIKPNVHPFAGTVVAFTSAVGTITTTGNPGNNEEFTLTDADGLSVTYIFKTGVATVDGTKDGGKVIIGVNGATGHAPSVGDRMRAAITASDLNVTVVETAGGAMSLTQNSKGTTGNTTIDMSGVTTVVATSFTGGVGEYTVEFSGYNYIVDELQESFSLSGSATVSALGDFSAARKSMYVGANRGNFNETVQQSSDVIINSARVWQGYLTEAELKSHALSFNEYGRLNPSRNAYLFEPGSDSTEINQAATMMLHWNFDQVTGSDANGEFFVADTSRQFTGSFGGSNTALNAYHGGIGFGFPASSTTMVRGMSLAVAKENLPENIQNSSLVTVETRDKERLTRDSRPINYYFAFEKSMYQTISEEMVKMFATIVEFNNLIGEPVNKYRPTYKKMDHLRSMFFANVEEDPDLDKYIEFYKWFDVSMAIMLEEVRPASMPGSDGIKNMVESHILERNKIQHRAPTIEFKQDTPEAKILGVNELSYDWEHGHAPIPGFWAGFDGTDDFIQVSDHNDFSFGDASNDEVFTLSAWVVFSDPASNVQSIISKYNANTASEYLFFNNNGYLQMNLYDLNTANIIRSKTNAVVFESGKLYHVAVVYGASGAASGIELYVNGVAPAQTKSSLGSYTAMHNTSVALQFGSTVAGTFDFARNMHHVMVIEDALTPAKVLELYNLYEDGILPAEKFSGYSQITSWWKMDQESYMFGSARDSKGAHHGSFHGNANIVHEYAIFKKQNDNCLWWKDREIRGDLLETSTLVDANRESIRRVNNTVVSGSTYATRRLTRPYRFSMERSQGLSPGSNIATNKTNNLYQGVIKFDDDAASIELTASNLQEQKVCNDVIVPNQKIRLHGKTDALGTDGYLDVDSDMIAPFSLYSSSVGDNALSAFKSGVALTNNHGDSYHIDGHIPLQGLFTAQHVGGKTHRNVEVTVSSPELRPEAYALEVTAGKIKIVHQPTNRPRSMFYRNEMIRRPVNIRNIRTTTGSYKIGNYQEVYEYALTNGRRENNNDFAQNSGYTGSLYSSVAAIATGLLDQPKPNRNKNTHVIVNRFSAPGGTEVMGDSNGGPNLDFAAGEYSVYNTLNHRNSLVREVKNELDAEFSERFGLRSGSTVVENSYEVVSGSKNGFASIHMTNRNELTKYVVASTLNFNTKAILFDGANDFLEIDETRAIYKNNQSFSVFAWIKHDTVDVPFQHTIWSHHDTSGANRNIFGIKGTSTNNGVTPGTLFFYQEGHSWQSLSSVRIDDNQWHHVGFVYEGVSNTVRLYVDGKAQLGAISISNIADQTNDSSDKVSIGQEFDGGTPSDFFKGYMTDVSIWSKPLINNEVHEIYTDGEYVGPHDLNSHTATSHLAAWYRMGDGDNGSGTADAYNGSIHDMSANSFHAVPTNLAASAIQTVSSELPGTFSVYERRQQRDNAFVQHPIPRNDLQYSWIAAKTTDTRETFPGYKHDFTIPVGIDTARQREIAILQSSAGTYSDFVGLHYTSSAPTIINSSINTGSNTFSYDFGTLADRHHLRSFIAKRSPYAWNSWKQLRGGDHPIAKYYRSQNIISIHLRDGEPNSSPFMEYERPHGINENRTVTKSRVIQNYQEPSVTSQYKPMELMFGVISDANYGQLREDTLGEGGKVGTAQRRRSRVFGAERSEVKMKISYANNLCKFANRDLMNVLKLEDTGPTDFGNLLESMRSNLIATPRGFKYSETIYPAEVNAYQKETRLRTAFVSHEWRDTRLARFEMLTRSVTERSYNYDSWYTNTIEANTKTNSQNVAILDSNNAGSLNYHLSQSMWALDARSNFAAIPEKLLSSNLTWSSNAQRDAYKLQFVTNLKDSGELQNGYSIFHQYGATQGRYDLLTAALYNRRIPQTVGSSTYLAGEAKWEAGDQAGKYPFEKDYNTWAEELRTVPDFSLIPEFRISEHIPNYLENGNTRDPIETFLELTGSSLDSSKGTFFKTYSNTDFMKYFTVVKDSLSSGSLDKEPSSLFLKCSAMLKMLPYEGFYPATRTLKIAELFQEGYTDNNFDLSTIVPAPTNVNKQFYSRVANTNVRTNMHLATKALYAPGVLYNSIKSGVAVDYPIFKNEGIGKWSLQTFTSFPLFSILTVTSDNASGSLKNLYTGYGTSITGSYLNGTQDQSIPRIKGSVSKRVSFEEMIDPSVLEGVILYDNEPHPSASYGSFAFGNPDRTTSLDAFPRYGLMFAQSESDATGSAWQADIPTARAGDTTEYSLAMSNFAAEVPNFFLKDNSLTTILSEPGPFSFNKSEIGKTFKMRLTFKNNSTLMYDNVSAFGPPVDNSTGAGAGGDYDFDPYVPAFLRKNADPFVEFVFTPTKREYAIDEMQGEVTASFGLGNTTRSVRYSTNLQAQMTLSSSLNLFGTLKEPAVTLDRDGNPLQVEERATDRFRWMIQTKWECPVLDFSTSDITLFDVTGSKEVKLTEEYSSTPGALGTPWSTTNKIGKKSSFMTGSRGMWHQYGQLPAKEKGYQIVLSDVNDLSESLASKIGFPVGTPFQVGQVADGKEIGEAIVAVPYYVESGDLNFFDLDVEDMREVLGEFDALRGEIALTPGVNPAVRHQIEMMQKYIFPPQMDFVKYRDKSPIAMYVFEFTHDLSKQDLVDLWQNLPPKIGQHAEGTQQKVVGHRLVKNGQVKDPLNGSMANKLQWMVFKVKRKAEKNYFKKLDDSAFQKSGKSGNVLREGKSLALIDTLDQKFSKTDGYSYNWPYDYFSLVELIKLDAEVVFRDDEGN